jgi:hypothetical protein
VKKATMKKANRKRNQYPKGWDAERVRRVAKYYDNLTEDEAVAEYEAAHRVKGQTVMTVPTKMVPFIRRLIAAGTAGKKTGRRRAKGAARQVPAVVG